MPTFAGVTERRIKAEAGFTLVELMVALAIMGLAAAVVVMTLPTGQHAARDEADRLAARLAAVRDLAVVEGRGTAAVLSPSGYGFERRMRGEWAALDGRGFAYRAWPKGIHMGGAEAGQVRIIFDRLGTSPTPQALTLEGEGGRESIRVAASGEIRRGR